MGLFWGTFVHYAYVRKEVEEGRIGRGHCISNYSSALSLNGTENQSVIRGCVKNEMFLMKIKLEFSYLEKSSSAKWRL